MTDLEITRLCADAMEFSHATRDADPLHGGPFVELLDARNPGNGGEYMPLHDDAQAMALVKRFHLYSSCEQHPPSTKFIWICGEPGKIFSGWGSKFNRAICECVAKMQQAKMEA